MDLVKEMFSSKSVIYKDSIVLYSPQDAVHVVKYCQTICKQIFGLDVFKLVGDEIQPFLELSTDYSCDEPIKAYEKAIMHISELSDRNIYLEVVYDGY